MYKDFFLISLVGAIINMVLTLLIPSLFKNNSEPLIQNIKTIYSTNSKLIIISSIMIFITIYLALIITPMISVDNDTNDINLKNLVNMQQRFY